MDQGCPKKRLNKWKYIEKDLEKFLSTQETSDANEIEDYGEFVSDGRHTVDDMKHVNAFIHNRRRSSPYGSTSSSSSMSNNSNASFPDVFDSLRKDINDNFDHHRGSVKKDQSITFKILNKNKSRSNSLPNFPVRKWEHCVISEYAASVGKPVTVDRTIRHTRPVSAFDVTGSRKTKLPLRPHTAAPNLGRKVRKNSTAPVTERSQYSKSLSSPSKLSTIEDESSIGSFHDKSSSVNVNNAYNKCSINFDMSENGALNGDKYVNHWNKAENESENETDFTDTKQRDNPGLRAKMHWAKVKEHYAIHDKQPKTIFGVIAASVKARTTPRSPITNAKPESNGERWAKVRAKYSRYSKAFVKQCAQRCEEDIILEKKEVEASKSLFPFNLSADAFKENPALQNIIAKQFMTFLSKPGVVSEKDDSSAPKQTSGFEKSKPQMRRSDSSANVISQPTSSGNSLIVKRPDSQPDGEEGGEGDDPNSSRVTPTTKGGVGGARFQMAMSKSARKRELEKMVSENTFDLKKIINNERTRRLKSRVAVVMTMFKFANNSKTLSSVEESKDDQEQRV